MHRSIRSSPERAGRPLRLMLIAILLAGLAGWQGWHCAEGAMATPLAQSVFSSAEGHHTDDEPSKDSTLLTACLSVLAAVAGTLILLASPRGAAILLRAKRAVNAVLTSCIEVRAPALAQLCVSLT